jgi:hypothetical protein
MGGTNTGSLSVHPKIRYNTIGGVNGPLVMLDNVRMSPRSSIESLDLVWDVWRLTFELELGQISQIQRNCGFDPP